jgi:peroxiredoxin
MSRNIIVGSRIPDVQLGCVENGEVIPVNATDVFRVGRSVIVGVPGAFTPVCTLQHVPDFVNSVDRLRASGFAQLVCIAPNDPFVLAEWAKSLDPKNKLCFLSDGNLDFTNALGLQNSNRDLFLSGRSERYMLIVENNVITRARTEPSILTYSCTRAADAVDLVKV